MNIHKIFAVLPGLTFSICTFAQSPTFYWANAINGRLIQNPLSVVSDLNGNVITCGFYEGLADFVPGRNLQ